MAILSVEGKCAISSDPAWHWVSVIPADPCQHPACGEGKGEVPRKAGGRVLLN